VAGGRGGGGRSGSVITVRNPAAVNTRNMQGPQGGGYGGGGGRQQPAPPMHYNNGGAAAMPPGNWVQAPVMHMQPAAVPVMPMRGNVVKNKLFVSNLDLQVSDNDVLVSWLGC